MPATIVVGGQFGSEGKGKVAHFLAKEMAATVAIRVGGPNSGHTVVSISGEKLIFRQLPTAAILPNILCVLPAGSYIVPELLLAEIALARLPSSRLLVDPNAVVVSSADVESEMQSGLGASIGSTGSGTGAAVVARVERTRPEILARHHPLLKEFVAPSSERINVALKCGERLIIEGTQGFGLSLLHSPYYPFVTSRDTTAAGFAAEAGISPLDVDDIVLTLRAFPIRVGGNSGPLPHEVDWAAVTSLGGHSKQLIEFTSVTKSVRRVARFDPQIVRQAIAINKPTRIVLNHLDYLDGRSSLAHSPTPCIVEFVRRVEKELDRAIDFCGFGANTLVPTAITSRMERVK
jgi:adenylosuccinate synthase